MVVDNVLGPILRAVMETRHCDIDNFAFKLHYRITAVFLFAASILVTCFGVFSKPIDCCSGGRQCTQNAVMTADCWSQTTFRLEHSYMSAGHLNPLLENEEGVHHAYYQWVPIVLLFQGLLFYIPHWLWKTWEGGKMNAILMGLSSPILIHEDRLEKITRLRDYILMSMHAHNAYAFKFFFCEVMNFVNVLFQMCFMNSFFAGTFMRYGTDVISFSEQSQADRKDPMVVFFPRRIVCHFNKYGPSGTMQTHSLMCILSLNAINEKIFIFVWFWFVMLTAVTCISFLCTLFKFCIPRIRSKILEKTAHLRYDVTLDSLTENLNFGDYFLLHLISKNVEMLCFSRLLEEVSVKLTSESGMAREDQEMKDLKKTASNTNEVDDNDSV